MKPFVIDRAGLKAPQNSDADTPKMQVLLYLKQSKTSTKIVFHSEEHVYFKPGFLREEGDSRIYHKVKLVCLLT